MKSIRIIVTAFLAVLTGVFSYAQTHDHSQMTSAKTETFMVRGNCDMCKARIEKAAKIDGVSKAEWNKATRELTLVYNPTEVNSDAILGKVAAAGHDTGKFKASDEVYKSLPECCKYDRSSKL